MATPELESDKVEQYSRRSNIRFSGIPETDTEGTIDIIVEIVNNDMEMPASRAQIERSNRLGPKN